MKYLYGIIAVILCVLGTSSNAHAQQDPHFTMYMFNKQMLNPGYTGSRETVSFNSLYRNQWVSMKGAPQTINAGIHGPIAPNRESKVALGILAFNDQITINNTFGLYAQYAYRIPLSTNLKLSIGLQGGFSSYSGTFSDLNPKDGFAGDNSINQNISSAILPNWGAGLYLYHDNYYVGVSVPRFVENQYDKDADPTTGEVASQVRHYFAMAGVVIPVLPIMKIRPNVIFKYAGNISGDIQTPIDADINLSFLFYDRFLVGASYRLNDSFDAMFEVQVNRSLRVGYAYDFTLSALDPYNKGSHEIMIGYDINLAMKAYSSPRFPKYF